MDPVEGSYLNPAAVANTKTNHLTLSNTKSEINSTEQNNFHIGMIDGGQGSISKGAFSYSKRELSSDSIRQSFSRFELSVAKYARAGTSYGLSFTKEILRDLRNNKEFVDYNADFGGIYNHNPQWSFGFLVTDIFTGRSTGQKRNTSLGLNYRAPKWFSYYLDLSYQDEDNPDKEWVSALGLEITTTERVKWRLGYRVDDLNDGNFYSIGFSWGGPRLGIYYAFQNHTKISAESMHILDLRVFF
jgi:opacity protein-like surface antigen